MMELSHEGRAGDRSCHIAAAHANLRQSQKMSKSERRPGHAIYLLDSPDVIRAKVLRAVTDSQHWIRFDENGPGTYNLLTIYELFSGLHRPDIEARFAGKGYSDFKRELAEVIIAGLRPVHSRHRALMAEATHIDALLAEGAARVRPIAEQTSAIVRDKIGLG